MMVIPPSPGHINNVKLWADESIWGHRFYNDQTPWLVLLEFLAVFRSRSKSGGALSELRPEGAHEAVPYAIPRMFPLRELVFNNPHILHVEDTEKTDSDRWHVWLERMEGNYDYSYLRDRFRNFSRFARVIEFFQSTALESHRQRRWTSRFPFPYGPHCIYAELSGSPTGGGDRRFFARGGELLYLMLGRSGQGSELASRISERLLKPSDPWDRIARALLPDNYDPEQDTVHIKDIGYLPIAERPEYGALAADWLRVLDLELPGGALLDPLMRVSGLHILLYLMRRSLETIGSGGEPRLVLEIAAPQKTSLREMSIDNNKSNRALTQRALKAHIDAIMGDPDWAEAMAMPDPTGAVRALLKKRFAWTSNDAVATSPEALIEALRSDAADRHAQHLGKVHGEWSRQIGLAVSRRSAGTWYAPDDALLKALVMTTVDEGREEYNRFLAKLYDRYRIVIGVAEAERSFGSLPVDEKTLVQNSQRLEQRLRTLGLLRRLSDDCAYVENPFKASA